MWEQLQSELKNSKIYVYSVAITVCILSIFGFVIFIASATDQPLNGLPSPTPTDYASILGAQAQKQPTQQPRMIDEQAASVGPDQPVIEPSPLPSPKVSPSPISSPSVSPSPSVSLSPSPTPTPTPQNNSDTSGPSISEIKSTGIEAKKATIEWKTTEDSDSKVEYGKETSYGAQKENSDKKASHSQELTDLEPNTTYHFRVTSKDNANNSTTSGDNTFTTLP